jgi:ankyrin repeat protein
LASKNGHLEIVKYLCNNRLFPGCTTDAMDFSSLNGHLDIVEYLYTKKDDLDITKKGGYGEIIILNGEFCTLFQNVEISPTSCTKDAITFAAYNGHFDIVRFLFEKNLVCKISDNTHDFNNDLNIDCKISDNTPDFNYDLNIKSLGSYDMGSFYSIEGNDSIFL